MRALLLVPLALLAACAPSITRQSGGNSPAERLFNQATGILEDTYNGYSKLDLNAATDRYRATLVQTCAGSANCAYSVGRDVLGKLLDELDDKHSYYENPDEYAATLRTRNGQGTPFPRLGISWAPRPNTRSLLILDTTPGFPAQASGLARGDVVTAINGTPLPNDAAEISRVATAAVRSGNPFTLTVKRGASAPREVRSQGKLVDLAPLPSQRRWEALPAGFALLRIPDFSPPTVAREFHKLVGANQSAKAIIVDLRGNPGGRATECTAAAGAFVPRVELSFQSREDRVTYRYNDGRVSVDNRTQYTIASPAAFKGRVAILVDEGSASCAEIMAAVIQKAGRGVVVGEPTFGILNTGNNSFDLVDGGGLTVTTIRTLDLSGTPYPERVTPNVAQADDLDALEKSAKDVMLERAVAALQNADTTAARPSRNPVHPSVQNLLQLRVLNAIR
jgi:carboxyl-terminal processing protease